MLAMLSVTNLIDLQTHTFLFSIFNSAFKRTLGGLALVKDIIGIGFGLGRLATEIVKHFSIVVCKNALCT